ncbi:MAG: tetratricopeptide repeat protein [Haliscomenobacter sp.]
MSRTRYGMLLLWWWVYGLSLTAQSPASVRQLYINALSSLPDSVGRAKVLADSAMRMSLAINDDNDSLVARCDFLLGVVYLYKSNAYLAETHFKEALASHAAEDNLQFRENCLNNLGIVYDYQNRIKEAIAAYNASLDIAEKRRDSFAIAQSWINLALMERKAGNDRQGIVLTKKVLDYSIRHGDSLNIGLCYHNLFLFYAHLGEDTRGEQYGQRGLEVFQAIGRSYERAALLLDMAKTNAERGNDRRAIPYFEEAERLAKANAFDEIRWTALVGIGRSQMKLPGGLPLAEQQLLASLRIITELGRMEYKEMIYQALADLYARKGDIHAYERMSDTLKTIREQQRNQITQRAYDELNTLHTQDRLKQKHTISDQQQALYRHRKNMGIIIWALSPLALAAGLFFFFKQWTKLKNPPMVHETKNIK